ncbi:MAG: NLP/P60 family protein [uncultured Sulfurovum sp.]|uniref:NLP/P60 family protein n=1 Tax=uncultured Sulfurovum sp. TaxID=269237 RepID=A0A6S6TAY1_9BACT|nr:MAG: NLP/P60 family protein [uncultured Sulfurovum sp.]
MDKIRNILLIILLFQFLVFLYVKLVYEQNITPKYSTVTPTTFENLIEDSISEIMDGAKELPQSSEYTIWDKEMIAKLNKEIQNFNNQVEPMGNPNIALKIESVPKAVIQEKVNKTTKEAVKHKKIEKKIVEVKVAKKEKKKIVPKIPISKKVAKYAKGKLGQKYVWGATGPNTFDCSGFTRDVFLCTTGIKIPRVSRNQAKIGTYVKYKELKRGDMVFFDTEKKYTGKVNHVGIYLSKGNFIHASSARKKVIITNFKKKPFYKKRFLWGRRVVKSKS